MLPKKIAFTAGLLWLTFSFFLLSGCEVSEVNKQDSLSSGTTSGYGSSGGPAANITLYAANNNLVSGATTTLTVVVTDGSGRRTDASIILTSTRGGTFNGTDTTLIGTTSGGAFIADYKANYAGDDEVTATVAGTALKATIVISVS
ncbi:MAG: hypothetical protein AB1585_22135 [Thermodesulfobacteriota bacterium]